MKAKIFKLMGLLLLAAGAISCNGWLTEVPGGTTRLEDYYNLGGVTCEPVVNGCYAPMEWEFGGETYFCEWFIGDICSDDAIKGGENASDMAMALDLEMFQGNSENPLLQSYYWAQDIGLARCNRAIRDISNVPVDKAMDERLKTRFIAEAKFLRAFYHFRLVRIFGRVAYIDRVFDGPKDLTMQRASYEMEKTVKLTPQKRFKKTPKVDAQKSAKVVVRIWV